MKAWKLEYETMKNAKPVVLNEEEQTWAAIEKMEMDEDNRLKMLWSSNVPGSGAPEHLIVGAIQSMENMGYNVEKAEALIEKGLNALNTNDMVELNRITSRIFYMINNLEKNEKSEYWKYKEYSNWDEYSKSVNFPVYEAYDVMSREYEERILAGWTAQICGGAFGTALEGYTSENLLKAFGDIRGYVRTPNTFNDDITYELAFLKAFDRKGYGVASDDIAEEWVAHIPFGWSAEDVALRNLKYGIYPPRSGAFNNPFREWIGAQMRGAICGMVAPGNPGEAARLAWMDGVISHFNNGVIGEIFNAVMVSLSFVEDDVRVILEKSIEMLPKDSEYYSAAAYALDRCKSSSSWAEAWKDCEKKFEKYNWIHAYPNAAAEVAALWFGNGSFDETMHVSAMCGQDVDCNAAQIGTIIGIIKKLGGIDKKWHEPIGDDLDTYVREMKKLKISRISEWTVSAARNANSR